MKLGFRVQGLGCCTEDTTREVKYPETRIGYEGLGKVVPLVLGLLVGNPREAHRFL